MNRLQLAIEQIGMARGYTNRLLENIRADEWFTPTPGPQVTHIAWQVGHLAMAQYRLALERIRGKRPEDARLITEEFISHFARESVPEMDPAKYPSIEEIRAVFDRVAIRLGEELPKLPEDELDKPILKPHPIAKTKLWSLLWCAQHEMFHAGEIALIRRMLGHKPLW